MLRHLLEVLIMDKERESFFLDFLKRELVTAMGCTEPAAAALAAASARKALGGFPEKIRVRASRDIIKNALHAGIPNSKIKGINAAVALGIARGDPKDGLNILAGLGNGEEELAQEILGSGKMSLELAEGEPPLFIEVWLEAGGRRAGSRIKKEHHRLEILADSEFPAETSARAENSRALSSDAGSRDEGKVEKAAGAEPFTLEEIYQYASEAPFTDIAFLVNAARTNMELALHSVKTGYGIQVGKTMWETAGREPPESAPTPGEWGPMESLFRQGAALAAAASDARMAGCSMPVVINSGSGNQGITISVPILVLAQGLGRGEEETARALCLANLTALLMTARKDRLSALCGAFTAAAGTAAGYIRLLNGDYRDLERCISNMAGNLIGLLCDGAKGSCAMKIYSCVEAAAMGAKIALAGHSIPAAEGILGNNIDETLEIIERLSHEGMIPLDKTVLNIMLEKERREV